jgi:hypothetical protein
MTLDEHLAQLQIFSEAPDWSNPNPKCVRESCAFALHVIDAWRTRNPSEFEEAIADLKEGECDLT